MQGETACALYGYRNMATQFAESVADPVVILLSNPERVVLPKVTVKLAPYKQDEKKCNGDTAHCREITKLDDRIANCLCKQ